MLKSLVFYMEMFELVSLLTGVSTFMGDLTSKQSL